MADYAPVALFVYRRADHAKQTLEALARNDYAKETDLLIFADGAKGIDDAAGVAAVRDFVSNVKGFRSVSVVLHDRNLGLAHSIVSGVTRALAKYDRVIVVEDDLVTSSHFLRYMNAALDLYREDERVVSVSGYVFPSRLPMPETFFVRSIESWGWATWGRAWKIYEPDGARLLADLKRSRSVGEFDFGGTAGYSAMLEDQVAGRNDSWAIRWYASAFLADKLTLFPGRSLVRNIGHDASGVHSIATSNFDVAVTEHPVEVHRIAIKESAQGRSGFQEFFERVSSRRYRILGRVRRLAQLLGPLLRRSLRAILPASRRDL